MSGNDPDAPGSIRREQILRAMLPIGIGLAITWVALLIVEVAVGETQRGLSIVQGILGLLTALAIIYAGGTTGGNSTADGRRRVRPEASCLFGASPLLGGHQGSSAAAAFTVRARAVGRSVR
jgi:hypothetical protein